MINREKYYCALPFRHIAIRPNGDAMPCCYFDTNQLPEDFNMGYKELFHNHPFMKQLRDDMLQGKRIDGCQKCYIDEELQKGNSRRSDVLQNVPVGQEPDTPILTYIDLALSNACNNRCRFCGPELSTNWYADAKSLGLPIHKGTINLKNYEDNVDFSKIKFIKLIGGEPLMEQEKFISVLERCDIKGLHINLITNATIKLNDRLLELFEQAKELRIKLSIDAIGPLNDFIRKGSHWDVVKDTLDWFATTFQGTNHTLLVNSVATMYNANTFFEAFDYLNNNHKMIQWDPDALAGNADWLNPANLPEDAKDIIRERISKIDHWFVPRLLDIINTPGDINKFIKKDKILNKLRNETWFEHNPELYELLKKYYD